MNDAESTSFQSTTRLLGIIRQLEEQLTASKENYEVMCRNFTSALDTKNSELARLRRELETAKAQLNARKIQDLSENWHGNSHMDENNRNLTFDNEEAAVCPLPGDVEKGSRNEQTFAQNRRFETCILELKGKNHLLEQVVALKAEQLRTLEEEKRQHALSLFEERLRKEEALERARACEERAEHARKEAGLLADEVRKVMGHNSVLLDEIQSLKGDLENALNDLDSYRELISDDACRTHLQYCSTFSAGWVHCFRSVGENNSDAILKWENMAEHIMPNANATDLYPTCNACAETFQALLKAVLTLTEHYKRAPPPTTMREGRDVFQESKFVIDGNGESSDQETDGCGVKEKFQALHESLVILRDEIALLKSSMDEIPV